MKNVAQAVVKGLSNRFPEQQRKLYAAFKIFDYQFYVPALRLEVGQESYDMFGLEELSVLIGHFGFQKPVLFDGRDADVKKGITREYAHLKRALLQYASKSSSVVQLSPFDVMQKLREGTAGKQCRLLFRMYDQGLLSPTATAQVEGTFSDVGRIKDVVGNRAETATVDASLRVKKGLFQHAASTAGFAGEFLDICNDRAENGSFKKGSLIYDALQAYHGSAMLGQEAVQQLGYVHRLYKSVQGLTDAQWDNLNIPVMVTSATGAADDDDDDEGSEAGVAEEEIDKQLAEDEDRVPPASGRTKQQQQQQSQPVVRIRRNAAVRAAQTVRMWAADDEASDDAGDQQDDSAAEADDTTAAFDALTAMIERQQQDAGASAGSDDDEDEEDAE